MALPPKPLTAKAPPGGRPPPPGSKAPPPSGKAPPPARARKLTRERVVVQDDGEGNWLVSYADMMTLLFGFFVIMTAFSTPDANKMERLKKQTAESMGGKYTRPYESLTSSLQSLLKDINLEKEVAITENDDGVTIVSKGTLFFDSGLAVMKPEAATLMDRISSVLAVQAKDFRIIVEGHTDDTPMVSKDFPSNWELSSTRAGTVIRLLESKGIPRKNLRPVGLGDTEPISPNRDAAGVPIAANQAENRRIVIRVQKQLAPRSSGNAKK